MIIDCVSDLHGFQPDLPGGDVLILAGDYTSSDKVMQWAKFFEWLKDQPYEKKILIAGNHDNLFETGFPKNEKESIDLKEIIDFLDIDVDFEYLCDSGTEVVINNNRLKIWGTPWTPIFDGVNYRCKAFMDTETYLDSRFSLIPDDLDILITHTPMKHILDGNLDGYACGSSSLKKHIDRASPKFHIFGHIHEQGGNELVYHHEGKNTYCINCSYVNERYQPANNYIRLTITP